MFSQPAGQVESAASTRTVGHLNLAIYDARRWMSWRAALLLILLSTTCRLVYLIWFCPYQLLGDEAYYWEQARHLDLCYNEKGPVLAWLIALCCRVFGDSAWAIRLPVAIASSVAAWGVGRLALKVTGGDQRAGFIAVAGFMLLPAFQANAIICTQDGLMIPLWLGLSAIALRLFHCWHLHKSTWRDWILLWVVLGLGVILKQSVLLFLASLLLYGFLQRRRLVWRRELLAQVFVGPAIVAAICSPMIIWNARHGWPMLQHTLGHLGAGGDQAGLANRGNPLTWSLTLIGGIIGAMGPALLLMLLATRDFLKTPWQDQNRFRHRLWLMCAAWPSVVFFLLLSLRKPVVPSWPLPSMVTLVVLIADFSLSDRISPALLRPAWRAIAAYGMGACLLIAYPTLLGHLPLAGQHLQRGLISRFTGHRESAAELRRTMGTIQTPDGLPPLIVTRHYMQAALDSFYLPGHPTVYTAGKFLGKRSTTFDQWADTNLENPALLGRSLLLDGEGNVKWEQALLFDHREPVDGGAYFLAGNYRGPRADHPRLTADED